MKPFSITLNNFPFETVDLVFVQYFFYFSCLVGNLRNNLNKSPHNTTKISDFQSHIVCINRRKLQCSQFLRHWLPLFLPYITAGNKTPDHSLKISKKKKKKYFLLLVPRKSQRVLKAEQTISFL